MEIISVLPAEHGIIGAREIVKSINSDKVKSVIIASNCPENLISRLPTGVDIKRFDGDEHQLGIKLGKPFPVAMVGYAER